MSSTTIDPEEARQRLARGEVRALDLRPADEVAEARAPTAVPASPENLDEAVERALRGDELPLLVFSADGEGTEEVAAALRDRGHDVAVVEGGWERWLADGLPVQPRSDEEYEGPDLVQPGVTSTGSDEQDSEHEDVEDVRGDGGRGDESPREEGAARPDHDPAEDPPER